MGQLPGLNCLNYPNVIRPLVMKLPTSLQRKWDERVVDFALLNDDLYPDFKEFAAEVRKRARLKNHPNVTTYANPKTEPYGKRRSKGRDEAEHKQVLVGNADSQLPINQVKHCQFHNRDGHDIIECKAFIKKTMQERSDWTKKNGLCFRCFCKDHIAKNCKVPVKCQKCESEGHLTLFHYERKDKDKTENEKPKEEVTSSCTDLCSGTQGLSCSKIILVDVFLEGKPNNVHRVYTIIDEQSNALMVTPALADLLGCHGPKEKYLLSTCSDSKVTKFGRRVQGLSMRSTKGNTFQPPTLIECDRIPSDKKEIPSPDLLHKFPHLRDIASEIPSIDPNAQIHLLNGRDAPELLKVRAFKNGPQGAPWAHKLLLGWIVSGQICVDRLGGPVHVQAHRTVSMKNGETSNHPTDLDSFNADIVLCPNQFKIQERPASKTGDQDVFRTQSDDNEKPTPIEDRHFLDIMEKTV